MQENYQIIPVWSIILKVTFFVMQLHIIVKWLQGRKFSKKKKKKKKKKKTCCSFP